MHRLGRRPPPGSRASADQTLTPHENEAKTITAKAGPLPPGPSVTDLVTGRPKRRAEAWDALVERYAPLVWSICRRHQLSSADADDASQTVWLHLVDQLDHIREPAALAGWLPSTLPQGMADVQVVTADGRTATLHNAFELT
jgi:hypothetical protein